VIERILPPQVAAVDVAGDLEDADLFAEEEAIVARAVESRRRAFATGRACARRALARLGHAPVAIGRAERRAPRWPPGVVGSITHCDGYRGAAVAWAREVATIGIDAEPNAALRDGILARVASAAERDRLAELPEADPAVSWDRLLFCAKEATYKAWFPLTGAWLGFEDAEVTIDPHAGTFRSRLLVRGPAIGESELTGFDGRWLAEGGLVAAAIALGAPLASRR
jgi:4'-phosphopantetheinyl transferase EntD